MSKVFVSAGFNRGYMYAPIMLSSYDDYVWEDGVVADAYSSPNNIYSAWATSDVLKVEVDTYDKYDEYIDGGYIDLISLPTNYLVTPRQMSWQENQSAKEILGMAYNLSNESWSTTLSDDGFYSSNNNYADIESSDGWADEYLWLPSLSEIGYSGTNGLWGTSTDQRACYGTNSFKVGVRQATMVNNTWTRSANYKQSYGYYFIKSSGDGKSVGTLGARVFRPCIHLNLTALEQGRALQESLY